MTAPCTAPPGVLITFEGPDGSGKTTQIARLAEHLRALDVAVEVTGEPKGTAAGRRIFELHGLDLIPMAEAFLMMAQRAQHVAETLGPWLAAGRVVLCDRFIDASVAYQGYGRGLSLPTIAELNRYAARAIVPDLTLILDVPPDIGRARVRARSLDRFEREGDDFMARVRAGYLTLAASEPRMWVIDAARSREAVAADIDEIVLGFLAVHERLPRAVASRCVTPDRC
jgi:dTMP kinase